MYSKEFLQDLSRCNRCKLCYTRRKVVVQKGDPKYGIMILGDTPSCEDDIIGEPFIGVLGRLLDKVLEECKLFNREKNFYRCLITNIVKCRTPKNRRPDIDEVNKCKSYLKDQLKVYKPKLIICLGMYSTQFMLNTDKKIGLLRGRMFFNKKHNFVVMGTWHPSFVIKQRRQKEVFVKDILNAIEYCKSVEHLIGVDEYGF